MTRQDVEMRFSLHSDCTLIVTLLNAPAIDSEDVDVIGEVLRIHTRALGRIAASNTERATRRLAAHNALTAKAVQPSTADNNAEASGENATGPNKENRTVGGSPSSAGDATE